MTQRAVISERRACFGIANALPGRPDLVDPVLSSAHLLTCSAAPQEDNQEELQRVLGVEFAKDDEEEDEHAGAVPAPELDSEGAWAGSLLIVAPVCPA